MKAKIFLFAGVILILASLLTFLASSVALARARDVPGVIMEGPGKLELMSYDPLVEKREHQAQLVLAASLVLGFAGIGSCLVAWRVRRKGG